MGDLDKLLTFAKVALFYDVSPRTVRHWVAKGAIDVVRTPGGEPRIRASSCIATEKKMAIRGNRAE